MTTNHIVRVGLDVGFGDVKAAVLNGDGKFDTVSFPAVLGQAQDLASFATGLGRSRRRAQRIVYDGTEYYVGEDALRHSRTQAGRQDRSRIGSVEERVLALAALAKMDVSHAYVVTGLPVLWFNDRRKLSGSLKGEHRFTWGQEERVVTIHGVTTVPQPLGGFYEHILGTSGFAIILESDLMRTYALLDIGWNTTDMTAIDQLQPVERWSGGERVGMRNVVEIVGDQVQRRWGLELQPHEVDVAIRRRYVEPFGKRQDIGDIIDGAIVSLGQQEVAAATRLWGNGERMTAILVFGGGAAVLGRAIRAAFPHNSFILTRPEMANAIGFCKFAQRRR